MVARHVRDVEAGSSNLPTPTQNTIESPVSEKSEIGLLCFCGRERGVSMLANAPRHWLVTAHRVSPSNTRKNLGCSTASSSTRDHQFSRCVTTNGVTNVKYLA